MIDIHYYSHMTHSHITCTYMYNVVHVHVQCTCIFSSTHTLIHTSILIIRPIMPLISSIQPITCIHTQSIHSPFDHMHMSIIHTSIQPFTCICLQSIHLFNHLYVHCPYIVYFYSTIYTCMSIVHLTIYMSIVHTSIQPFICPQSIHPFNHSTIQSYIIGVSGAPTDTSRVL